MTDRPSTIHKDPQSHDLNGLGENKIQSDANSLVIIDPPLPPQSEAEQLESPAQEGRRSWGKTAVLFGVILGIGALGFLGIRNLSTTSGAVKDRSADKQLKVTPVLVATAIQKTVPVQISAIGTVQSGLSVSVIPQVSGRIDGVFFKKGQEIKKGQLLFTLNQQPQIATIQQAQGVILKDRAAVQQAQATLDKDIGLITLAQATLAKDQGLVKQAKAVLAKDIAQAKFAQGQSQRYGNLYKQGAVSLDQAQQYTANNGVAAANIQADTEAIRNAEAVVQGDLAAIKNAQATVRGDRAAIKSAQAAIDSDQGALKNAQVQLGYTKIYAPIAGRAGNILVQVGNVAQAGGNTPLMTILQVNPIQVSFAVPASNLAEVQKRMNGNKLPVDVQLADTNSKHIAGQLSFVNNTVDNTTGTIQLIGDFNNSDGKLYPGQYVNATLTLSETPNAIVIPSQAVQNGPNGQFVFVVKPDMTVTNTPVVATSAADGLNAIQKGLKAGDRVVTDGQANLVDGAQVKVKEPGAQAGDRTPTDRTHNRSSKDDPPAASSDTAKPAGGQP